MGAIDYAALKILSAFKAKGDISAAEPIGFIVGGKEGPLREGEVDRVTEWTNLMGV